MYWDVQRYICKGRKNWKRIHELVALLYVSKAKSTPEILALLEHSVPGLEDGATGTKLEDAQPVLSLNCVRELTPLG